MTDEEEWVCDGTDSTYEEFIEWREQTEVSRDRWAGLPKCLCAASSGGFRGDPGSCRDCGKVLA